MEDNYFDKKIKSILESPPEYEASAEDLELMQQQLRAAKSNTKGGLWSRWWYLLLLLPLLLLAYLYMDLAADYNDLEKEILAIRENLGSKTQVIDTVYQKTTIYQIDTIFRKTYQTKRIPIPANDPEKFFSQTPIYPFTKNILAPTFPFNERESFLFNTRKELPSFYALNNTNPQDIFKAKKETQEEALLAKKIDPISGLKRAFPLSQVESEKRDFYLSPFLVAKARKSKTPFLPAFKPEGISLGLGASPLIFPLQNTEGNGFLYGLQGEIHFRNDHNFVFGAEVLSLSFESKTAANFSVYPSIEPINPTDNLKEIKAKLSYLQIPMMYKKSFFISRRFQPGIGIGVVAYRPIKERITYEFIGNNEEYESSYLVGAKDFKVNQIRFLVEPQFDLGANLALALQLQYQQALSKNNGEVLPLKYWAFGLKTNYTF